MAELVVYGRESCSACKRFRGSCEHHGIKYRFADIDSGSNKAEMLRKLRATEWFKGGKFGLPLVDVYGKLLQRPSEAAVKAARDALPKDDQVENLKRQFKELDLNQDGLLSFQEMDELLQTLAPQLSQGQRQKLFCAADVNQNGVVELEEFIDFVMYGKVAVAKICTESLADTEASHEEVAVAKISTESLADTETSHEEVGSTAHWPETKYGTWSHWKENTLEAHNWARRQHGVPDLAWSDECYDLAKKQAQACQAAGQMLRGHCDGASGRHGQNLYWNPCSCPHPNVIVSSWLSEAERPGYDFAGSGPGAPGMEQFSQVVWKATRQVAMALSEDEKFCVANYFPAGNAGNFKENVFRKGTAVPKAFAGALAAAKGAAATAEATFVTSPEGVETLKVRRFPHPTIDEILDNCPGNDFKEKIEEAFQQGADLVTIDRVHKPPRIHIRVIATKNSKIVTQFRRGFGGG